MITARQEAILSLIVEHFAVTKEAIGSKALQAAIDTSSATIRNDMAKLEKVGLLEKTHTSSGRIPSRQGIDYFVSHLLAKDIMDPKDLYRVVEAFDFEAYTFETILEKAAQALSDVTACTSLVLDVEPVNQILTGFDMIRLSSHDALAVLTLNHSKPVTVQFAIPKHFLERDLEALTRLVQDKLLECQVRDIHYALRTEIPQIIHKYFIITDQVLAVIEYIFHDLFEETVFVAGKGRVLDYANWEIYQLLETPKRLAYRIRQEQVETYKTQVTLPDEEDELSQVSLITHPFIVPHRGCGVLAILAPIDVSYKKMISLVNIVGRLLDMKLADYYRYLSSNHYEVDSY